MENNEKSFEELMVEKLRQYENADLIDATKLLEVWNTMSSRCRTEFDQIIMAFPRACRSSNKYKCTLNNKPNDTMQAIRDGYGLSRLGDGEGESGITYE